MSVLETVALDQLPVLAHVTSDALVVVQEPGGPLSVAPAHLFGGDSASAPVRPDALGNVSGDLPLDLTQDAVFELTATGTINLPNPTAPVAGTSVQLFCWQDGTGGRALSTGSAFDWDTDSQLSATPGTLDVIQMQVMASGRIFLSIHNFKGGGGGASVGNDIEITASADGAQVHAFAGTRARVFLEGLLLPSSSHTIASDQITIGTAAQVRTGDHIRITAY